MMTITDVAQLPELVDLVHDHWFDVETIVFDRVRRAVTLHVEPKRSFLAAGSSRGITVEVKNVEELIITDTEKVGHYDINEITFDPSRSAIVLTGGIPIEIVFRVSALEIHTSSTNSQTSPLSAT